MVAITEPAMPFDGIRSLKGFRKTRTVNPGPTPNRPGRMQSTTAEPRGEVQVRTHLSPKTEYEKPTATREKLRASHRGHEGHQGFLKIFTKEPGIGNRSIRALF